MYDEYEDDYDDDVSGDAEGCHGSNGFYGDCRSGNDTGKGDAMDRLKVVDIVLRAAAALIAAGIAIIKCINHLGKLKPAKA